MKLIIDIPEEAIKTTNIANDTIAYLECCTPRLLDMLRNGTPLPKGHGRLVDADVFEKRLMDARSYYIGEKADDFDLRFAAGLKSAAERLVDAPTIIEADTESEVSE